jgi:hypothetical protein
MEDFNKIAQSERTGIVYCKYNIMKGFTYTHDCQELLINIIILQAKKYACVKR